MCNAQHHDRYASLRSALYVYQYTRVLPSPFQHSAPLPPPPECIRYFFDKKFNDWCGHKMRPPTALPLIFLGENPIIMFPSFSVLHALGMHEATYMYVALLKFFSILSIVQLILVLYIVDCFWCITSPPHVHEVRPNTYMYMYTSSIKFYLVCRCQFLWECVHCWSVCACKYCGILEPRSIEEPGKRSGVRLIASMDYSLRAVKSVYLRGMAA